MIYQDYFALSCGRSFNWKNYKISHVYYFHKTTVAAQTGYGLVNF